MALHRFTHPLCACMLFVSSVMFAQPSGWYWVNPRPQGDYLYDVQALDAETGIAVGELGTIIKTTDGGMHWDVQHYSGDVNDALDKASFASMTLGWAVGESGAIIKTTDGGFHWTGKTSGTSVRLTDVHFLDPFRGVSCGENIVIRSTDGGENWTSTTFNDTTVIVGVRFRNANSVWAVGYEYTDPPWELHNGVVYGSTDGGSQWTRLLVDSARTFSCSTRRHRRAWCDRRFPCSR